MEDLIKQAAQGSVSPELANQCTSHMQQLEAPSTKMVIDYDTATIQSLKKKFEGVTSSICECMSVLQEWPVPPPRPVLGSHLPSGMEEEVRDESPGLPFPQDLGSHIAEMWSRSNLKPACKGGPGKLWRAHYDKFCGLAYFPSPDELKPLQMDLSIFKERSKSLGLAHAADSARQALKAAITVMRLNANVCALNQFESRESINCQQIVELLSEATPNQSTNQTELFDCLGQNLAAFGVASWASHTLAFSMADTAARDAFTAVHALRRNALWVMFGKSCPQTILDRLISMPIQPGSLFGQNFHTEITALAKNQSSLGSLSAAVVQLGGSTIEKAALKPSLPRMSGFKAPQALRPSTQAKPNKWHAPAWNYQASAARPAQAQPKRKAKPARAPKVDYRSSQAALQAVPQQLQQQQQLQIPQQWAQQPQQQWAPQPAQTQQPQPQLGYPSQTPYPTQPQGQPFRKGRRGRGRGGHRGGF